MDIEAKLAKVVNTQKGEQMALHCLCLGVMRSLSVITQAAALKEFDIEVSVARKVLLEQDVEEHVSAGFDRIVDAINVLRLDRR